MFIAAAAIGTGLGLVLGLGLLALVALALAPAMADPTIIGPQDSQLALQASVTKTATFNSTGLDLGSGFAPAGGGMPMQAIVNYSAGDFTTGDETYTFKIQDSPDNSAWTDRSPGVAAPVTVAAPAGAITIPCSIQQRYVRLVNTIAGTTPTITYSAYLQPRTVN